MEKLFFKRKVFLLGGRRNVITDEKGLVRFFLYTQPSLNMNYSIYDVNERLVAQVSESRMSFIHKVNIMSVEFGAGCLSMNMNCFLNPDERFKLDFMGFELMGNPANHFKYMVLGGNIGTLMSVKMSIHGFVPDIEMTIYDEDYEVPAVAVALAGSIIKLVY